MPVFPSSIQTIQGSCLSGHIQMHLLGLVEGLSLHCPRNLVVIWTQHLMCSVLQTIAENSGVKSPSWGPVFVFTGSTFGASLLFASFLLSSQSSCPLLQAFRFKATRHKDPYSDCKSTSYTTVCYFLFLNYSLFLPPNGFHTKAHCFSKWNFFNFLPALQG